MVFFTSTILLSWLSLSYISCFLPPCDFSADTFLGLEASLEPAKSDNVLSKNSPLIRHEEKNQRKEKQCCFCYTIRPA